MAELATTLDEQFEKFHELGVEIRDNYSMLFNDTPISLNNTQSYLTNDKYGALT